MKRLSSCCFTRRVLKINSDDSHLQSSRSRGNMENTSKRNGIIINDSQCQPVQIKENIDISCQSSKENVQGTKSSSAVNIIQNHDFSGGLHSWHPNCCEAFVVSSDSGYDKGTSLHLGSCYALVTNRKECWQGLEQDITSRVSKDSVYLAHAYVGVSGSLQGSADVQATLKLENRNSETSYMCISRKSIFKGSWEKLEGTFSLSTIPDRVIFYLEGPSPDVDLLIQSVSISCYNASKSDNLKENAWNTRNNSALNIIHNHDFSGGLHSWHPNSCEAFVISHDSGCIEGTLKHLGSHYAVVSKRKECWQGLEQDITGRVSVSSTYVVHAFVAVSGSLQGFADVLATLKLEYRNSETSYLFIARKSIPKERWEKLEGTFSLSSMPDRVIFYLEGPSPGVDLLIQSVAVFCSSNSESDKKVSILPDDANIIVNPQFEDCLNNWSGRGCKIVLHDSMEDGRITPKSGKFFVAATERTQSWNGIQQEITGKVKRKLAYEVTAVVCIFGNVTSADVQSTLWVQATDLREQYIGIASVQATDKHWVQLQGKFLLSGSPSRVVIYLEGPPPGTDILVNSLILKRADKIHPLPPPAIEDPAYGKNIISNSNLSNGTNGWFPLGNCNLSAANGSPHIIPPMARDSLGTHEPLSGRYILVTKRTQTWMGPAQMITDKIKLYLTYQISAWVRIGHGATTSQNVSVALDVDDQWVNGGQVEIADNRWHEIGGSFRIEKQAAKVMVYVQGPASGIDLMVAGLQIFPVDRTRRFKHLKKQIDKVRKRDVILKFSGSGSSTFAGNLVKVRQTQNSFPFGSCLSRRNIDDEDFVDFFVKNFNWAVFENELKWNWNEPEQGNFNYKDADEMVNFCVSHNIQARGHCIFWEVEGKVQQWIRNLNKDGMSTAVKNRLAALLTRYKGKFQHYDVNNEMLHGSFYQDRLGKDIWANMFKTAHQLDPSAVLFVNDYHIEDGCDPRSSPERYIQQILDLQEQGAPVGGIGIQGHIDSPIGTIVCSALDKLGILGLPIWFTEIDVSSNNEFIRAEDLEVMLLEAYAHPAVEGVMLWGFWELFMCRENSHLVNAEGDLNEAGKKYIDLKKEWLSNAYGPVDDQGKFYFRGFQGSYELEIVTSSGKSTKTFVVAKGAEPLEITINL